MTPKKKIIEWNRSKNFNKESKDGQFEIVLKNGAYVLIDYRNEICHGPFDTQEGAKERAQIIAEIN